ncbi:MAG: zf-HC2 domain-containing protein [Deltaproteobacteria bacterium]|nr:zf-HC2 domain-containing protein [Deltaproteobacteria bacterium]
MMSPNCTSAPLSWLVMEQYHLGELPQSERERVRRHLQSCPGCAKCMDSIENSSIRLKPLPEIPTGFWATLTGKWKWQLSVAAMAAASVLLILLVWPFSQPQSTTAVPQASLPPALMAYKGGDLAIGLTRYRNGAVDDNPSRFVDHDAFGVRVTCPPIGEASWDVVVFQGADVYFPYDNQKPLNCGNRIALDGVFEITGQTPTTVCITVDAPVNRKSVTRNGISALPNSTVCTTVRPAH